MQRLQLYNRGVHWAEFQQRVRRHRPAALLPRIADIARTRTLDWMQPPNVLNPWTLAAAARVSLLYGNEHRDDATARDVVEIATAYGALDVLRPNASTDELRAFFLRIAYEQFPYQGHIRDKVGRSLALFEDSVPASRATTLTAEAWQHILGGTLREIVGVGFLLFVSADVNHGWFDPAWLDAPNFAGVRAEIPAERIRELLATSFTATPAELRADGLARFTPTVDAEAQRCAYNPLSAKPAVRMPDGRLLLPTPLLLIDKISPTGLYYAAMQQLDPAGVGRDLGVGLEHYVGRHLGLVPGGVVTPQVPYGRSSARSVDWIVVFPDLVLLVEVKATRLTLAARMGDIGSFAAEHDRTLGKAYRQIDATAALIRAGQHEFVAAGIPTDLPIRALVVTLEPFYLVHNAIVVGGLAAPPADVPTWAVSVGELEQIVGHVVNGGPRLPDLMARVDHASDLAAYSAGGALARHWPDADTRNPITVEAWSRLPFDNEKPGAADA